MIEFLTLLNILFLSYNVFCYKTYKDQVNFVACIFFGWCIVIDLFLLTVKYYG